MEQFGNNYQIIPFLDVPGRIRTSDLSLRRRSLYPAELQRLTLNYGLTMRFSPFGQVAGFMQGTLQDTSRRILAISNNLLIQIAFTGLDNNDIMIDWI